MKTTKEKLFFLTIGLLIFFFLKFIGYTPVTAILLFIGIISINITLIFKSYLSHHKLALLAFIYIFLYSFVTKSAFIDGLQISVYKDFNDIKEYYNTSLILYFFLLLIWFFMRWDIQREEKLIGYQNNIFLFYIFATIALLLAIFGKSGDNIFDAGGYATGANSSSSLNEYFFIPLVISIIFSNNKKTRQIIIYIISAFYALKNLLYGGRIEIVMVILCIFAWQFYNRFSIKQIIIYSTLGFYFFIVIGNLRDNPLILFSNEWTKIFSVSFTSNNSIVMSQEGDVFYATNRWIGMINKDIILPPERIESFIYFIASIFVPFSYLPDIANLSSYKSDVYPVGGGGLIFGPFYVYFSYFGVIFIAYLISYIISNIGNFRNNLFLKLYCLFVFITLPRWFAYSAIVLFKLCIYGTIITLLIIKFNKDFKKNRQKQINETSHKYN